MDNESAKSFINVITSIATLYIYHIVSTSSNRTTLRLVKDRTEEVRDYLALRNMHSNLDSAYLQTATRAMSKIKEIYNEEQLVFPNFDYFKVRGAIRELTDLLKQV